jgi:hypothetical protein
MPRIIKALSPNPRIRDDEDATLARYGDLEYLYEYIIANGGGGGALNWQGTWSPAVLYNQDAIVYYNGSSYIATSAVGPSAIDPSVDTANWDIVALEGQTGATGPAGQNGATGPAGAPGQNGLPGAQGQTGNPGPVGMTWRGGWSNLLNYSVRDVVFYDGSAYICTVAINASNNNPAATPANWDLVAREGDPGTQGIQGIQGPIGPVGPTGLNWQGLWSASGAYVADDAVGYNGASWFCINPVGPSVTSPDLDPVNWALLAAQGAQGDQGLQGIPGNPGTPGAQGPAGPANTLTIGTVTSASTPSASITGTAPNQTLNLVLAKGDQGDPGPPGPPGPAGSGSVVAANAIYVSKSGNDTTGVRDNLGLSFFTIEAALAIAVAGDTIVVFPGDFELSTSLVLKNDVNFYFIGQGKVTLLLSVLQPIFQDSNTAVTCNIFAPGWTFEGRGVTASPSNNAVPPLDRGYAKGVIRLKKASDVTFTADKLISEEATIYLKGSQGTAVEPSYVGATVPKIRITANVIEKKYFNQAQFDCCIGAEFAEFEVNAGDIIQTYPTPLITSIEYGNICWEFCKKAIINADRIINYEVYGLAVYQDGAWENDEAYITASLIKSGYGWTLWAFGNGNTTYARVDRVESRGDCCVIATGATKPIHFILEGTTIYSDLDPVYAVPGNPYTDGIVHCEVNGTMTLIGCRIERSPATVNYGGNDVLSTGSTTVIELQNTYYNFTRVNKSPAGRNGSLTNYGQVKNWNGTAFVETPYILKTGLVTSFPPTASLFSSIEKSTVEEGVICYNGYTNCVIRNCNIYDSTLVFTANSQVIENLIINKNVLISPPPFQSVNYGTNTSLTGFVNLQVGVSGSGATTVNLPACAVFNGSISSNTLTVTSLTSGTLRVNQIITGAGIPADTIIIGPAPVPGQWFLSRALTAPITVTAARASYVVNNKVIVTDLGAGGGVITVDAGSNARIVGTSQSQTYTLNPGEVAEFVLSKTDSGNFLWKLLETPSFNLGNAVYVSKSGSDTTGSRNVLSRPFLTINAALAAAQTGDTVVVFPGDFETVAPIVLRNNINFNFIGTGLLTLNTAVIDSIFTDATSSGAVNCTITAPGWTFEGRGFTLGTETLRSCIKLTKASEVNLTVKTLLSQDTCITLIGSSTGTLYSPTYYDTAVIPKLTVHATKIHSTGIDSRKGAVWATIAELHITADYIWNNSSLGEYYNVISSKLCPLITIKAVGIENFSVEGQCIYHEDCNPTDKYYVDAEYIKSGNGWTVWFSGTTNPMTEAHIRAQYIRGSGDCTVVATYTTVTVEGAVIENYRSSGAIDGIVHGEGGTVIAKACRIVRTNPVIGNDVLTSGTPGGKVYLIGTSYNKSKTNNFSFDPASIIGYWDGTDFAQYKEVTITSSQVLTLGTSPVQLLGAPAANKYYSIEKIILEYTYFTAAYTVPASDYFWINSGYYMGGDLSMLTQSVNAFVELSKTTSSELVGPPGITSVSFTFADYYLLTDDVNLTTFSGVNPSAGDGSIKAKIWYKSLNFG